MGTCLQVISLKGLSLAKSGTIGVLKQIITDCSPMSEREIMSLY